MTVAVNGGNCKFIYTYICNALIINITDEVTCKIFYVEVSLDQAGKIHIAKGRLPQEDQKGGRRTATSLSEIVVLVLLQEEKEIRYGVRAGLGEAEVRGLF